MAASAVSSLEALAGVLGFAVATGLLFGRVSRPSARIGFSQNMLVAPYQGGASLQFRVVNQRSNSLMELEARVMLMTVEMSAGQPRRTYTLLRLEREQVMFFPLTWTVVHPIDADSPLWGKTA
jgi:inward rectifier potassium channel